ncbi:MAG: ceramidase domain-containing protein [Pseudomonadota bacterium]
MEWQRQIDGYCERVGPEHWAEPLNAVSNLAFLLAAWVMWRRVRGQGMPLAVTLVVFLAGIGVGSSLLHTFATVWAAAIDVAAIVGFILVYIFAINRDVWQMRPLPALGLTVLFFPYAAAMIPVFGLIPGLGGSVGYAPVPLLILIYAVLLLQRAPQTATGMAIGAGILIVSILFRSLDEVLCEAIPRGTHFMWHILNGVMLGWMIEVYRRHLMTGR